MDRLGVIQIIVNWIYIAQIHRSGSRECFVIANETR